MLLPRDDSKLSLPVTTKPTNRLQFWLAIVNICAYYLQIG